MKRSKKTNLLKSSLTIASILAASFWMQSLQAHTNLESDIVIELEQHMKANDIVRVQSLLTTEEITEKYKKSEAKKSKVNIRNKVLYSDSLKSLYAFNFVEAISAQRKASEIEDTVDKINDLLYDLYDDDYDRKIILRIGFDLTERSVKFTSEKCYVVAKIELMGKLEDDTSILVKNISPTLHTVNQRASLAVSRQGQQISYLDNYDKYTQIKNCLTATPNQALKTKSSVSLLKYLLNGLVSDLDIKIRSKNRTDSVNQDPSTVKNRREKFKGTL